VRVARPTVRNLRPAAVNLARATPDFTASFHELNRFFNMAAFNRNGAEPVYPNPDDNASKRDEGYLYWAAWTAMDTDSMFSTSDALGPFRRALFGLSCDTIKNQLASNPATGVVTGLLNTINDPVLCGNPANPSPIDILPLPKKGAGKGSSSAGSGGGDASGGAPAAGAAPSTSTTAPSVPSTSTTPSVPLPTPDDIKTDGKLPANLGQGR
jgi:hypothetical protein